MRPQRLSPIALAACFAALATGSSLMAAYVEGHLFQITYAQLPNGSLGPIVPYSRNLSIILDFLLLDPFVLFFMLRSSEQRKLLNEQFRGWFASAGYHHVGAAVLSLVIGVVAMKLYVESAKFFDATVVPSENGGQKITITGWIVFSWTALYIAALTFFTIEQANHTISILRLVAPDIPYNPFHPDEVAGMQPLAAPSISMGYAMIGLLLTLVLFIVQDRILYHVESNRLLAFAAYLVIALSIFVLPIYHLHRLMKARRNEYLFSAFNLPVNREEADWRGYVVDLEGMQKQKKIVMEFPTWPLPISIAIPPLGSIIGAAIPLVQKAAVFFFPQLAHLPVN